MNQTEILHKLKALFKWQQRVLLYSLTLETVFLLITNKIIPVEVNQISKQKDYKLQKMS